jgi:hypothetical protein
MTIISRRPSDAVIAIDPVSTLVKIECSLTTLLRRNGPH